MKPQANEIYKHFKGNLYKVMAVAIHSETEEEMVVYQALYGDYKIYVRPLDSFISPVDKVKYPNVSQEKRFELISAAVTPVTPAMDVSIMETSAEGDTKSQVDEVNEASGLASPEEMVPLRPLVEQFIDADSIDERKNILEALRPTVTQDEITIMATIMDIEIDEKLDINERYRQLHICLDTKSRFETLRLR